MGYLVVAERIQSLGGRAWKASKGKAKIIWGKARKTLGWKSMEDLV
jgi:hypothetical protein